MAISGIDKQIMIARAPDVVRDVIALQRKPEVTQDYLAVAEKAKAAHEQSSVLRTQRVAMDPIRADADKRARYGYGIEGLSLNGCEQNGHYSSLLVAPSSNLIDIIV